MPETSAPIKRKPAAQEPAGLAAFTEKAVWQPVGAGWRHLHGSVRGAGASFEWHDFEPAGRFDWGKSFHPGSVEVCLNVSGEGRIRTGKREAVVGPLTALFYRNAETRLEAWRAAGQRHQFLTVEMSFDFLSRQLGASRVSLHPLVAEICSGGSDKSAVAPAVKLSSRLQQLLTSLRDPPVLAVAQKLWYEAKALEVASELFFVPPDGQELFCQRQQQISSERVEKVIGILRANLAEPPTLEQIGQMVACSPFHLSRTFSAATGMTIPQYLRQLRLERAAELLKSGKMNVTEAALEVGYSSLSHFSQAFHAAFGCCPGLYPLRTTPQSGLS